MIDGIKTTFGGREFIVPPANMKTVKKWLKASKESTVNSLEYMEAVTDFIWSTLQRNYPDVERDFVDEHLDAQTKGPMMRAISEAAGVVPGEQGAQTTPA